MSAAGETYARTGGRCHHPATNASPFAAAGKFEDSLMMETTMNKIAILAASALLAGTCAVALAGSKGASSFSPGHQMQAPSAPPTTKGASEFSPGDQMKDLSTKPANGASGFSPGDQKNDLTKKK
jgi:hypothetical protein